MIPRSHPMLTAGLLLGIGLGGFIDGILLHQILQLHNMLSALYPPTSITNLELNMVWDGIFHLVTWITTVTGLFLLWREVVRGTEPVTTRRFLGSLLAGWGLFNLVEGIIDHHILHLHHVVERLGESYWDITFLLSGALFFGFGLAAMQEKRIELRHTGQ